jgi:hypothetical protein
MTESNGIIVRPPNLPSTRDEFLLHRKKKGGVSINDQVEDQVLTLVNGGGAECERYLSLLNAVHNQDAVEGSLRADTYTAAMVLREFSRKNGVIAVADAPLEKVAKAQGVFLRRYGLSRRERRKSVEAPEAAAE